MCFDATPQERKPITPGLPDRACAYRIQALHGGLHDFGLQQRGPSRLGDLTLAGLELLQRCTM
ncbi:hypothetical protein [Streptomyces sp. NBC_00212]|uniref:hypothetical protein n=1 Tax=Streptomyces sp. NBC_00212 TaxID=2975684 RepID=UPI0032498107